MLLPKLPHESTEASMSHLAAWVAGNIEAEDVKVPIPACNIQ